jgi:hypothetical protein
MKFVDWMLGVATRGPGRAFYLHTARRGTRDCIPACQFLSCLNHVERPGGPRSSQYADFVHQTSAILLHSLAPIGIPSHRGTPRVTTSQESVSIESENGVCA